MDIQSILEICETWSWLGGAMQEQAKDILEGQDLHELVKEGKLNPNALQYIQVWLEKIEDALQSDADESEWDTITDIIQNIDDFTKGD